MSSGVFTAADQASDVLGTGDDCTVRVRLSGAFTGRILLQEYLVGVGVRNLRAFSSADEADVRVPNGSVRLYVDSLASGTVSYSLAILTGQEDQGGDEDSGGTSPEALHTFVIDGKFADNTGTLEVTDRFTLMARRAC